MKSDLPALLLAAFALMGSPGPATMSLAGLGSAFGFRSSLHYLFGIVAGTTAVLLMIATGVTALILAQPSLLGTLTLGGGIYILYLAWKIATAPVGRITTQTERAPAFVPDSASRSRTPRPSRAIGAVYSGHTLVATDLTTGTIYKVAVLAIIVAVVNTVWLALGATFSRFLTNPVIGRTANILFATMLVVSVGMALFAA